MAWSPDPELQQMFLDELDERSGRLASGAGALATGDGGAADAAAMRREGHTIKGTARAMGYEGIGLVGLMIEEIWGGIADGTIEATPSLGGALAALCVELEIAAREDPQAGTEDLARAAATLHEIVPAVAVPEFPAPAEPIGVPDPPPRDEPPASRAPVAATTRDDTPELTEDVKLIPPVTVTANERSVSPSAVESNSHSASPREAGSHSDTLPDPSGSVLSRPDSRGEPPDVPVEYGGLIGAVESWASAETVTVNAGRLYRLINRTAATRAEAAALSEMFSSGGDGPNELRAMVEGMERATEALQTDMLGLASLPLSTLTGTLPQLVKYLSRKLGKNVELEISGDGGMAIDRQVLEAISEPVRQLIVNSIYHGLEVPARRKDQRKPSIGVITLDVALEASMLEMVFADDGEGVDWDLVHETGLDMGLIDKDAPHTEDLIPLLFEPGFTTGAIEGGYGDGLARLAAAVEALHGRVHFETWPGAGTRVTLRVPAWQALQRVLIVWAGGLRWAIPEAAIERTMPAAEAGIGAIDGVDEIEWEGRLLPLLPFATAAGVDSDGAESILIILSHRVGTAAFAITSVERSLEVAVTELAPLAAGPEHVTGVALLGAGEVALVIDAGRLVERTHIVPGESRPRARVLVVDDSKGARAVLSGSLSSSGFSTSVAGSVAEALDVLADLPVDALVVDFAMPSTSGIALVREVRRRDRRIPIVMISAVASEEDMIRAKKAGVDRFFDKSDFREGALVAALWDLLER